MIADRRQERPVDIGAFRAEMREAEIEEIVPITLDTYREEAIEHRERLKRAIAADDPAAIGKAAHAMKSAAGAIKATTLATLLLELETAGKANDLEAARGLTDAVWAESDLVLEYLEVAASDDYRV